MLQQQRRVHTVLALLVNLIFSAGAYRPSVDDRDLSFETAGRSLNSFKVHKVQHPVITSPAGGNGVKEGKLNTPNASSKPISKESADGNEVTEGSDHGEENSNSLAKEPSNNGAVKLDAEPGGEKATSFAVSPDPAPGGPHGVSDDQPHVSLGAIGKTTGKNTVMASPAETPDGGRASDEQSSKNSPTSNAPIGGTSDDESVEAPLFNLDGAPNEKQELDDVMKDLNRVGSELDSEEMSSTQTTAAATKAMMAHGSRRARRDVRKLLKRMSKILKAEEAKEANGEPETRSLKQMEAKLSHVEVAHDEKIVGCLIAAVLLGFVSFDLCVLYMVNYPDDQVRSYSYKMVSQCLSVLIAVLVEAAQLTFIIETVLFSWILGGHPEDAESEHGGDKDPTTTHDAGNNMMRDECLEIVTGIVIFLVWFYLISRASKWQRNCSEGLFAVNAIVAHETAFVAIHAFGDMQEDWSYAVWVPESPIISIVNQGLIYNYILTPLCFLIVLRVLTTASSYFREAQNQELSPPLPSSSPQGQGRVLEDAPSLIDGPQDEQAELPTIVEGDAEGGEDEVQEPAETGMVTAPTENDDEAWRENSIESEDEMCAIVIAWFLRQSTLFFVCGRIPFMEGDFSFHTPVMFVQLAGAIGFYCVMMIAVTWYISWMHRMPAHQDYGPTWWRLVKFSQALMSMAVAWHILSFTRWTVQFYVDHEALQFVTAAFVLSPFCIFAVVIVDKLADFEMIYESTAEISIESVGLLVGFAWEKAFHMSIRTVVTETKSWKAYPNIIEVVLCTCFALFLLPAWRFLIIPNASQKVPERLWIEKERKRLSAPGDAAALAELKRLSQYRQRIGED